MTRSINRPMIALLLIMALLGPATATAQTPPPPISIGQVQGAVGNSADGDTHRSSFALPAGNGTGQTVTIQGVIYQKTLSRSVNSSGVSSLNGFFIQNAPDSPDSAGRPDGDPNTSDGIFVFTGGSTTLIDGYRPTVGDEVRISGRVSEFFSLTQLSSARLVGSVVRSNVDLGAALPPFETDPPDELADAERYWERREGMRAQVPAGSIVLNGRNVFAGALDGEVWLARGDSAIAQRSDRYARRAFRDPHPLDNDPTLFDDGNGYRILLGSQGIKAAENNRDALIAPSRTYDSVTNAPIGGVSFSFSKYQVQVGQQL